MTILVDVNNICPDCGSEIKQPHCGRRRKRCENCTPLHDVEIRRTRYQTDKREAFQRIADYHTRGKVYCVGCGLTDLAVLSMDHLNCDGAEDRRRYNGSSSGAGDANYRAVARKSRPVHDLRILCMNCQRRALPINYGIDIAAWPAHTWDTRPQPPNPREEMIQ